MLYVLELCKHMRGTSIIVIRTCSFLCLSMGSVTVTTCLTCSSDAPRRYRFLLAHRSIQPTAIHHGSPHQHRRRNGAIAPKHPRPKVAPLDLCRRQGWCRKDDNLVLSGHPTRKAPQECPPYLDRSRPQLVRCFQPEVWQGRSSRQWL
jgi:hypothetical protein